jgi:hypothetical protein
MSTPTASRKRIAIKRYCFILCLYLITPARMPAEDQPRVQGSPEVQADKSSGSGTTLVYFRNDSKGPLTVILAAGPVTLSGASVSSDTQVCFGAENDTGPGEPEYKFTMAADATTKVKAFVTRAWGTSPLDMYLLNGSARIGKLVILPSPINVSLVEPTPDKPELHLVDGSPARIILKNDDPISHALSFRLIVGGRQLAGHEFRMAPLRSSVLEFVPTMTIHRNVWPSILERLHEIFKPQVGEGSVLYLFQTQGATVDYSSPAKIISLSTSFNYFSPEWRQTLNYFLIVLILILGGVASLTFGHLLPNLLERLNVVEQLNELARITSNLSSNIGSRLGVLIRLERSRLSEILRSRTTISPDFETTLTECKARVAKLASRVGLLQQLDIVIGRIHQLASGGAPPSRIDEINQSLQQTSEILKKDNPADTDLQDAQKSLAAAVVSLDAINGPSSDFGKALFQKVQDMTSAIPPTGTNPTFDRISTAVPGPAAVLKAVPPSPTEVVPASYASVDIALRKIQILRDYAVFAEGTTSPETKDRLQNREGQLISYLSVESWEALQAARLLLQEMKDDLYPERLREALIAHPIQASIEMEPATAYEEEPLEFSVRFTDHFINTSSARQEWVCTWAFGDGLQAQGWLVSHYFILPKPGLFRRAQPGTFDVTASFQDADGKQVTLPDASGPVLVERQTRVQPSRLRGRLGERAVAEVARLSVALLIAVFALVAGVKDQLVKLDLLPGLIAVFVAGYGVDVLKNLISSSKSS